MMTLLQVGALCSVCCVHDLVGNEQGVLMCAVCGVSVCLCACVCALNSAGTVSSS